jgi:hypothetical protein
LSPSDPREEEEEKRAQSREGPTYLVGATAIILVSIEGRERAKEGGREGGQRTAAP